MIKLLPYIEFVIESSLSEGELLEQLAQRCKGEHSAIQASPEPLVGEVVGSRVKACRAIGYRNSFLPIATGHVTEANGQSILKVKLRPPIYTLIPTAAVIVFLLVAAVIIGFTGQKSEAIVPLLVAVAAYTIMQLCFWLEVPKIQAILKRFA